MTNRAPHPPVTIHDGRPMADSRDVAVTFGRQHKDVLRAYRDAHCSPEFRRRNFAPFYIKDLTGESLSHVLMSKNGFAFLVLGFTGAEAGVFKEAYIDRFDAMEAELRAGAPARIDVRDPAQLALIATQLVEVNRELAERVETAERAVAIAAPKVAFVDRFIAADGLYGLQNAARALGQPPQAFIDRLKKECLFYQGGSLVPRSSYANRGLFVVRPVLAGEKSRFQTFVTAKGLNWLADRLQPTGDLLSLSVHQ